MLSQVFYLSRKVFVMYIANHMISSVLRISVIGITSNVSFFSCLKMVLASVIGRQGSQQHAHEQHIQLFIQEIMAIRIKLINMGPKNIEMWTVIVKMSVFLYEGIADT